MTRTVSMRSLSQEEILDGLRVSTRPRVSLEIYGEVASTNQHLLDASGSEPGNLSVCLAESQSAGRGRRGKVWYSPLYAGLYLSAGWQFHQIPSGLTALTLAVGVIIRRVIQAEADLHVKLKWPNDLIWEGRKLGGILVEAKKTQDSPCYVVVGIGLNVAFPKLGSGESPKWRAGAVDLYEAVAGNLPSRAALVSALIEALLKLLENYGDTGFLPYHGEFMEADFLKGRVVELEDSKGSVFGRAVRVEPDGFLLLETARGMHRVSTGDISVRNLL